MDEFPKWTKLISLIASKYALSTHIKRFIIEIAITSILLIGKRFFLQEIQLLTRKGSAVKNTNEHSNILSSVQAGQT